MKYLLILLLLGVTLTSNGQASLSAAVEANPKLTENEKQLIVLTDEYHRMYENLINGRNKILEPITRFLDKDFASVRYRIDTDGNQTKSELNLQEFKEQIDALQNINGLNVSFTIEKVNYTKSYETLGIINYSLLLNATLNGEPLMRFRSIVTDYFKRENDASQWKIFESNGISSFRDYEFGICTYAILQTGKDENQYSVKIVSPAGNGFNTDNLTFQFKAGDKMTLITCGSNVYKIVSDDLSCIKENNNMVDVKLGKPTGKVQTIQTILAKHLYNKKCVDFKELAK